MLFFAAPRSSNPDHILRSLHRLKVHERIKYKINSTTYKLLQSSSPRCLRDLITVQPPGPTRSSTLVTLLQPPVESSLKITDRSFRYAAPHLWNELPSTLRIPASSSTRSSPSSGSNPGLVVDISHGVFHSRLKTYLFSESFPLSFLWADLPEF